MLLSIVIPVYNTADYLQKCLDSVVLQEEDDFEIILVDDGSTDRRCPAICDEYKNRYPCMINLIHKENGGTGSARNTGILQAKGEYICFLDSDDYLVPGSISCLKKALKKCFPDVLQFGYRIEKNEAVADEIHANLPADRILHFSGGFITMAPMVWNRIWKRTLFTDHNIWFPEKVWFEDLRTSLKLLAKSMEIVVIPDVLYVYVQREGSIMHNTNVERNIEILEAIQDLVTWFQENKMWERYYDYICKMAVFQILVLIGSRVAKLDPKNPMLEEFHAYLNTTFPGYMRNPLLKFRRLPRYYKVMLLLMYTRNYRVIRWLYLHFQVR